MCTLILAFQVFPEAPVVVAANRDEQLDRSSRPPEAWPDRSIVAPRDEQAGGTWLGYNAAGVLVGIANRWLADPLEGDRSRGQLVLDALTAATANVAARTVEQAIERHRYAGFNLLFADATTAILFEWDGFLRVTTLDPGLHVIMNAGYDDRFVELSDRSEAVDRQQTAARDIRTILTPRESESVDAWLDRAAIALGDHDLGVCVHGDGFGTRSSSVIAIRTAGNATYRYADGPPCETPFAVVETEV